MVDPVVVVDGRVVVVVDGRVVVVVVGRVVVVVVGGLVVVVGIWAMATSGPAKMKHPTRAANNAGPPHLRIEQTFDTVPEMRDRTEVRGWGPSNTR